MGTEVDTLGLEITVDAALEGSVSTLKGIVGGVTDADGNWVWDDWDVEEQVAFIQQHEPGWELDSSDSTEVAGKLNAALNNLVIEPNLPSNITRRATEDWLRSVEGDTFDADVFGNLVPRREVGDENRREIVEGLLLVADLETVSFEDISLTTSHVPDAHTEEGSRLLGSQLGVDAAGLYLSTMEKIRAESVQAAINALPAGQQGEARALLLEIEAGDGSRIADLEVMFRRAAEQASQTPGWNPSPLREGALAVSKSEGGDDLTWNLSRTSVLNKASEEHSELWNDLDPDIASVSKLATQSGTQLGTVHYGPSYRPTGWENTQEAQELGRLQAAERKAFAEAGHNRQLYADLMAKPADDRTPGDWAELRRIEDWAATTDADGDGVPDYTLNWWSREDLDAYDPHDPQNAGPAPPPEQLNQPQLRAELLTSQKQVTQEALEAYEFGSATTFNAGSEAVLDVLYTDTPIVVDRGEAALWALEQGVLDSAQRMMRVDPESAERVIHLWHTQPSEALRIVSKFETTQGMTVMSQATRDGLELRAMTPDYLRQLPTASAEDYATVVMQKAALLEGVPVQRTANAYLAELSELLAALDQTAYDASHLTPVLARIVGRLGETGFGNPADVYLGVDGRWHVMPGARADTVELASVMKELAPDIAWFNAGLNQAAQYLAPHDPTLASRLNGAKSFMEHMVELNFRHPGAGFSENAVREFVQAVQNGEVYEAGPPFDIDLFQQLVLAADDTRMQTVKNDVVMPLIEQLAAQADDLGIDLGDQEAIAGFLQQFLAANPQLLENDGTTFTGGTAGNVLLNAFNPQYAATQKSVAHLEAEFAAGRITRAQLEEGIAAARAIQKDLLLGDPFPPEIRLYLNEQLGVTRSQNALNSFGNREQRPLDAPADWMEQYGYMAGVANLAAATGLTSRQIIDIFVEAGSYLAGQFFDTPGNGGARTWVAGEQAGNTNWFLSLLERAVAATGNTLNIMLSKELRGLTFANLAALLAMPYLVFVWDPHGNEVVPVMAPDAADMVIRLDQSRIEEAVACDDMESIPHNDACTEARRKFRNLRDIRDPQWNRLQYVHELARIMDGLGVPPPPGPPETFTALPVTFLTDTASCEAQGGMNFADLKPGALPRIGAVRSNIDDIYWDITVEPAAMEVKEKGTQSYSWLVPGGTPPPDVAECRGVAKLRRSYYDPNTLVEARFDTGTAQHICRAADGCTSARTEWGRVEDIPVWWISDRQTSKETAWNDEGKPIEWEITYTCNVDNPQLSAEHAGHALWDSGKIVPFHDSIANTTHPGTKVVGTTDWCLEMGKEGASRWKDDKWAAEVGGLYDHELRVLYKTLANGRKPGAPVGPIVVSETSEEIGVHIIRAANVADWE